MYLVCLTIGLPDYRTVGLLDRRTIGVSDNRSDPPIMCLFVIQINVKNITYFTLTTVIWSNGVLS